jgi:FKBP-type peptidyl-prolyl cis-trans isomerase FkpA
MRRLFSVVMAVVLAGCSAAAVEEAPAAPESLTLAPELGIDLAAMQRLESGVRVRDMRMGEGPTVRRGDDVSVRYVGWLPDGTLFDAVVPPNAPREFRLGGGEVIRGWEQGVLGMRVGGQRQIIVPPAQGYGRRSVAGIPPGSTLVFLVELVSAR